MRSFKRFSSKRLDKIEFFKQFLMQWGVEHTRNYPWRQSSDPYYILVAEFLLQRTRADQVQPVYREIMREFPSLEALANARDKRIQKIMFPLGLSYRATRLKMAAEMLLTKFDGKIPQEPEELMKLPGVGPYIANAVCCFAFGANLPIVDANVLRIVGRVWSINFEKDAHKEREVWANLQKLLKTDNARKLNLALLDLGDSICTSRNPKCSRCPLSTICDYRRLEVQNVAKA